MVFEQGSAAGGMFRIVPEMHKIMVERGVYNKETLDDIVAHIGSVQHVDWLDDHEKDVFKTAFEVDQFAILRYASVRQPFICQGQSLNFFVSEDGDEVRIAALHREAFLDENILSLYYIYSRSGVIVSSVCSACEA
jgi:ribonucleoside-diphosphate reductase alpha chain